jgi:hypothetical protein
MPHSRIDGGLPPHRRKFKLIGFSGCVPTVVSAVRLSAIRLSRVAIAPLRAFAPLEYVPTMVGVFQPASRMIAASGAPSSTRSWVAPILAE